MNKLQNTEQLRSYFGTIQGQITLFEVAKGFQLEHNSLKLVSMLVGQDSGRISTSVNHRGQLATALNLKKGTHSPHTSLDRVAPTVVDPVLKSTAFKRHQSAPHASK